MEEYYFGAGGLVRAYTEAATKAVEKAEIAFKEKGYDVEIYINYQDLDKFKYYCNKNNIQIVKLEFGENIKCIIEVTEEEKNNILADNRYNEKIANILKYNIIKEKYIRK